MLRRNLIGYTKTLQKCIANSALSNIDPKLEDGNSGTEKELDYSQSLQNPDYFNVNNLFTLEDLYKNRVHYGHKVSSVHPVMKQYLFGSRLNHIIFDLDETVVHLRKALNFAAHIAYREGIILFISRNPRMTLLVEDTAKECKEFAVTRQWKFGTLTNSMIMFQTMIRHPDLCIFMNTLQENGFEHPAIKEAAKMLIPTIAIVDSNCNPNLITYPVPGNDDSVESISLYCDLFKKAILLGKKKRAEDFKALSEGTKESSKPEKGTELKPNSTNFVENFSQEAKKRNSSVS